MDLSDTQPTSIPVDPVDPVPFTDISAEVNDDASGVGPRSSITIDGVMFTIAPANDEGPVDVKRIHERIRRLVYILCMHRDSHGYFLIQNEDDDCLVVMDRHGKHHALKTCSRVVLRAACDKLLRDARVMAHQQRAAMAFVYGMACSELKKFGRVMLPGQEEKRQAWIGVRNAAASFLPDFVPDPNPAAGSGNGTKPAAGDG